MRIDNLFNLAQSYQRQTAKTQTSFASIVAQKNAELSQTASTERTVTILPTESYTLLMPKEGTLVSTNSGGRPYRLGYADDSTPENPVMIMDGLDENGNTFESKVYINNINIRNATNYEMAALGAHLKELGSLSKDDRAHQFPVTPPSPLKTGFHERTDYIYWFQKDIADQRMMGYSSVAQSLERAMNVYLLL